MDELAVGEGIFGFEFSGGRAQAREAHGELGFPANALQVFEVSRQREGLETPIGEAEKRPDADAAESRLMAALGAVEPPIKILLRSREVHSRIDLAMVGLLINNQSLRASTDDAFVVGHLHRRDLDRQRWHEGAQTLDARLEVGAGDELRMLAGDEQDIAETLGHEMPGLLFHLVDFQGDALDRILAREAAVGAGVDALVREVERSEKPHRPAEVASRDRCRIGRETLQAGVIHRLQQGLERPQERGFLAERVVENLGKTHRVFRAWRTPNLIGERPLLRKRRFQKRRNFLVTSKD